MSEERTTTMRVAEVRLYCDCGGEMRRTNAMLCMNPPLYPHRCGKCGATENKREAYPAIRYVSGE